MQKIVCDVCSKELGKGDAVFNINTLELRKAANSDVIPAHFCCWSCLAMFATTQAQKIEGK